MGGDLCYHAAMSSSVEYLFGPHIDLADAFARTQGWRPCSRVSWLKRHGTTVYFLSLLVQLEIVSRGETVHVIGQANDALRILKRVRAVAVCH
jgi:hypothetical protein